MLGGQHMARPLSVPGAPFVLRGTSITRTHAYALHRRTLPAFHQHIWQADDYRAGKENVHFDLQLGRAHYKKLWPTYAPLWWLAGQAAGWSDNSLVENPALWWSAPQHALALPFVALPDAKHAPSLADHLHLGCLTKLRAATSPDLLHTWLHDTAQQALARQALPAWPVTHRTGQAVEALWPPGIIDDLTPSNIIALSDYPWHGRFKFA
jgi:hypothetical protein